MKTNLRTTRLISVAFLLMLLGFSASAQTFTPRADVTAAIAAGTTRSDVTPYLSGSISSPSFALTVWAHANASSSGNNDITLGNSYPLYYSRNGTNSSELKQAAYKATGVDAIALNYFFTHGTSEVTKSFAANIADADNNGYKFCLCLDGGSSAGNISYYVADATTLIERYVTDAGTPAQHPGVWRYNGKPIINFYRDFPGNDTDPTVWSQIKANLIRDGKDASVLADVSGTYTSTGTAVSSLTQFTAEAPAYDQDYLFGVTGGVSNNFGGMNILAGILGTGKPFWWSTQAGYFRNKGVGIAPGYTDALGTSLLQNQWKDIFSYTFQYYPGKCQGAFVSTLDDFDEETYVIPSSTWNYTRADLTAWYSSVLHSRPPPFSDPRQYLTAPQMMYQFLPGGTTQTPACVFEVSAINPTNRPIQCVANVINSNGATVSGTTTLTLSVAPKSVSRGTISVIDNAATQGSAASWTPSPYILLKSVMAYADGVAPTAITTTLSPPCAVTTATSPWNAVQIVYQSIASNRTMDSADTTGAHSPTGTLTYTAANATKKFTFQTTPIPGFTIVGIDLLHDTRMDWSTNLIRTGSPSYYGNYVPNTNIYVNYAPINTNNDDRGDGTDHGYYIIRMRDADDKVIYSRPLALVNN